MKNLILVLYILSTIISGNNTNRQQRNEVKGIITVSDCQKTVTQGNGYNKDGTEIMHSDDPMTQPNRNIVVSMHPLNFEPELTLTEDAYVSQSQQTFIPNILPIVVGSKVHFLNEDEFFHNVQSYTSKSKFSIGRRAPGISYSVKIKKIGIVDLTCDIHPHMNAKILSFDTPYFCRVNEDGSYSIKDLPNGKYRLEVFHPYCDDIVKEVEIIGGKVFEFNHLLSQRA